MRSYMPNLKKKEAVRSKWATITMSSEHASVCATVTQMAWV